MLEKNKLINDEVMTIFLVFRTLITDSSIGIQGRAIFHRGETKSKLKLRTTDFEVMVPLFSFPAIENFIVIHRRGETRILEQDKSDGTSHGEKNVLPEYKFSVFMFPCKPKTHNKRMKV